MAVKFNALLSFVGSLLCAVVLMGMSSAQASEVPAEINKNDPYVLVQQVANKTFDRFAKDKALIDQDLGYLKLIVSQELIPYVDYKFAAYKVLGQYLKESSPEQRAAFVEAFKGYMIATYAQALTEYTDQTVAFSPAKDFTDEKIVDVYVQVIEQGRPPINIQFKARRLKDDSWKAFDLVAEGVSLLASKQSEIQNLIRQKGIDAVITMLDDKTNQPIQIEQ